RAGTVGFRDQGIRQYQDGVCSIKSGEYAEESILDPFLTWLYLLDKMSNMKETNIRELQHHLSDIMKYVEHGEEVLIKKRRRVIARIVPD
ncbi:MAG TPA: hypothetical protein DF383_01685, partial [Deltaproteobacteria bacterium]|nr:hypothetical protein [Deltaproteobacteria bacterium]